jgi:16S rRNA (cytosine967-C5)-methyltransferase
VSAARAAPPTVDPARRAAYEVLRRTFEHGAWTDRAFPAAAERHGLEGAGRARAQWLAYGAVQRRGTSDHLVERLSGRPLGRLDPPVMAALRLGLFEVLYAESAADHAAVGDAVELAKRGLGHGGARRAKAGGGFVNALLRRAVRERTTILAELNDRDAQSAALAHSLPEWLAVMWWDELGAETAREVMRASNEPLPTALRANLLRLGSDGADILAAALVADGGEPQRANPAAGRLPPLWPPEALVLERLGPSANLALASGDAFAQALAAQAVVELLDPRPGERVLDLCAGPGFKTVAIAARMGGEGELVAVERDPDRAAQIREHCGRAGARNVTVVEADAAEGVPGEGYDRVLVDPPCSDLGTLASRPDARWRKSPAEIPELAESQSRILGRGAAALRPGGTLVYSTCTISRRESEDVAGAGIEASALAADDLGSIHSDLASPHDPRFLQTRPDRDRTDGFFIARLRGA